MVVGRGVGTHTTRATNRKASKTKRSCNRRFEIPIETGPVELRNRENSSDWWWTIWQPRAKNWTLIALSAAAPKATRNVVETNSPTSQYSHVTRKRTITKENRVVIVFILDTGSWSRTGSSDVRQQTGLGTRELKNSCLIGHFFQVIVFDGLYGSQIEYSVAVELGFTTERHVANLHTRENPNSLQINGTRSENSRRLSTHMANRLYTFTLLYQNLVMFILDAATICNVGKLAVTCLLSAGRSIIRSVAEMQQRHYNLEHNQERFNAEC